jgi:hypothetical protein
MEANRDGRIRNQVARSGHGGCRLGLGEGMKGSPT